MLLTRNVTNCSTLQTINCVKLLTVGRFTGTDSVSPVQLNNDRVRLMTDCSCQETTSARNRWFVMALLICAVDSLPTYAEVPIRQRAVDVLILQDGARLLGALLPAEKDGTVSILTRGTWLKQNVPELYARFVAVAQEGSVAQDPIIPLLTAHIRSLAAAGTGEIERMGFLKERLQILELDEAGEPTPDVIVIEISEKLVRRKLLQKPVIRELAGVGILNGITDVETLKQADVRAAVRQIPAAELVRSLPPDTTDDVDHRFRRLLLQTDRIFGRTCRLILQAGRFISEDDANANPETLALELLAGQVRSQLSELLNETAGASADNLKSVTNVPAPGQPLPPPAVTIATGQQAGVVEVSQMKLNATTGSALVTIDLYHRDGKKAEWGFAGRVTGAATHQDISADQQQVIANDPRVKQITQLFGGLGAGAGDLTKAISVGAAVEVAQNRAKENLQTFVDSAVTASEKPVAVLRTVLTERP